MYVWHCDIYLFIYVIWAVTRGAGTGAIGERMDVKIARLTVH